MKGKMQRQEDKPEEISQKRKINKQGHEEKIKPRR
tara:strand:- start:62 stop:166 length:105 start_codon:yes stop_codon:yes gene_type:complete